MALLAGMGKSSLTENITRDGYWSIVSDLFNDRSVAAALDLRGRLNDADASANPLCLRIASIL